MFLRLAQRRDGGGASIARGRPNHRHALAVLTKEILEHKAE